MRPLAIASITLPLVCRPISPYTRVVVLTSFAQGELLFAAIKAGALSYLLKDADTKTVLGAIQATIHAWRKG